MSDRTNLQCYIYACPDDQKQAAADALSEMQLNWGCADATPRELVLNQPYTEDQARCGSAEELAAELREAAPGASFVLWEDPAYEWLGSLQAYTPELGEFAGECDADGQVVAVLAGILAEIDKVAGDAAAIRAALHRAMGGPWFDDWSSKRS